MIKLDPKGNYVMYLRKSRADLEAEARGESETLARHERALTDFARKLGINISAEYKEVVSGETIASRPEVRKLINEVELGIWTGVLVMEIERLARGDTKDQGIIADAFKYSDTLIITPSKIYDPNNEFDEEYFEFGLFMSRREYKTIRRRMERGRIASVKEGKYVGNIPPYGYERIKLEGDKGYTLGILPEQAEVVRYIYELYTVGEPQDDGTYRRLGCDLIKKKLDLLGIKPPTTKNQKWSASSIRGILTNPVYTGVVFWQRRKQIKKSINGTVAVSRPWHKDYMIFPGLHSAIIPSSVFDLAQEIRSQSQADPIKDKQEIANPLSGIVVCGKCGHNMVRKPAGSRQKTDYILCNRTDCDNISAPLQLVEEVILDALDEWLKDYKVKWDRAKSISKGNTDLEIKKIAFQHAENELDVLRQQLDKAYTFLEQGIYSTEIFLERSGKLSTQISDQEALTEKLREEYTSIEQREKALKEVAPRIEKILQLYRSTNSIRAKNDLLKEVLEKVEYTKNIKNKKGQADVANFEIRLFPKLPSS